MSEGTRYAPDGRIYGIYGATVFGMQTVEATLRTALIEAIVVLGKLTPDTKRALPSMTLGSMIEKLEILAGPGFKDEFDDLRHYTKNRNHVAHQFFLDYVDAVGDEARDDKAEAFLRLCHRESVLALHRIEVMTRELHLPLHMTHKERKDLELMERLKVEPSERIQVRKFRNA